jgi:hypothetical protein
MFHRDGPLYDYAATFCSRRIAIGLPSPFSRIDGKADTVLIDGRFRVACGLRVLMEAKHSDARVLIHDFFDRPQYHVLLDYYDVKGQQDTLALLQRKPDINPAALQNKYDEMKYVSA